MARKQKHEDHVNHERWLVSYADFITLLFAFFVVMYAISSVNVGKYRVLSDALVAAFSAPTRTIEPIQVGELSKSPKPENQNTLKKPTVLLPPRPPFPETPVDVRKEQTQDKQIRLYDETTPNTQAPKDKELSAPQGEANKDSAVREAMPRIADEIERALATLVQQKQVSVQREQRQLEIEINESVLFGSGRARLEPQALPVIGKIADILKSFANRVHVEGFTDNVPIKTPAFPSNWELSAARAASVAHLLAEDGLEEARLAAIGYGEQRPVADNTTAEGRRKNRRIVLVVLADETTQQRLETEKPGISRERTGGAQEARQEAAQEAPVEPQSVSAAGEFTIAPPSPPPSLEAAVHAAPPPFVSPAPVSGGVPGMPSLQDVISVPVAPPSPAPAAEPEPAAAPVITPAPSAQPATPRATAFSPMAAPIRLFSPIALPSSAPGSMTTPVPPAPVSAAAMPPAQETTSAAPVAAAPVVGAPAAPSPQEVVAAPPVAVMPPPAPVTVAPPSAVMTQPPAAVEPSAPQPAAFAPIAPPIRLFAPLTVPPVTRATPGNTAAQGGRR